MRSRTSIGPKSSNDCPPTSCWSLQAAFLIELLRWSASAALILRVTRYLISQFRPQGADAVIVYLISVDGTMNGQASFGSAACGQHLAGGRGTLDFDLTGKCRKVVRSQKSEVRSQKSEVRSQKSEVRSQKSEVRSQKSEVRSQKSEVKNDSRLLSHDCRFQPLATSDPRSNH